MLISLEEAKKHLRVEHNADDEYILNLIIAAQDWAESFLNLKFLESETQEENNDTENYLEVKEVHKMAMLLVIGSWYENRENVSEKYVPYVACSLLWPFRKVPV